MGGLDKLEPNSLFKTVQLTNNDAKDIQNLLKEMFIAMVISKEFHESEEIDRAVERYRRWRNGNEENKQERE